LELDLERVIQGSEAGSSSSELEEVSSDIMKAKNQILNFRGQNWETIGHGSRINGVDMEQLKADSPWGILTRKRQIRKNSWSFELRVLH